MLTRVRIEVEESTAERCVEALWKYEHAIVQQEVRRFRDIWPITVTMSEPRSSEEPMQEIECVEVTEAEYPTPDQPWSDSVEKRHWFNNELGREVTEEVIEYDESLPGYRGRRVVRFVRLDLRDRSFHVLIEPTIGFQVTGTGMVHDLNSGSAA